MKVKIKGFLTYKASLGQQELELDDQDQPTLRGLLTRLFPDGLSGDALYDAVTGSLDRRLVVLVSGRHYSHLSQGLDTRLKDGDEVAIFPPMAGG